MHGVTGVEHKEGGDRSCELVIVSGNNSGESVIPNAGDESESEK